MTGTTPPEAATAPEGGRPTLAGLRVTVVGLGPMGRGIARVFAAAGADTVVADADAETTRSGAAALREEAEAGSAPVTVRAESDLAAAVSGAHLCLEAVVEDPEAKHALLTRLAAAAPAEAIIASNTSSLSLSELGRAFGDPARVVGMHFFNPPTTMRLVEVVAGARTSADTLARAEQWSRAVGKTPIRCTDSPNFVVNRVCRPLYYEAQLLVTQQVEPAVVDAVARAALGHPVGPLELLDFVGLHTHVASSETAHRELGDPRYRPVPLARTLVRAGLTGRAAGGGFYDYATEKPSAARARVVRPAPAGGDGAVAAAEASPEEGSPLPALVVTGDPSSAEAAGGTDGALVLYSAPARADEADAAAVTRLRDRGARVVVDSSHGGWAERLPTGVGWLRLHRTTDGAFAEVVDDPVAGIVPTADVAAVLAATGAASVRVPALPGLVADRLAYCLVNEAVQVAEEGTADEAAVDTALTLGMNHPAGPFALLDAYGPGQVLAGLEGMQRLFGDPRYRPAALLRRRAVGSARGSASARTGVPAWPGASAEAPRAGEAS